MTLEDLIKTLEPQLDVIQRRGHFGVELKGLTDDSRRVSPGSLFVAMRGGQVDGHDFISKALAAGASGLVVQENISVVEALVARAVKEAPSFPILQVRDSRRVLGLLASRFHGNPSGRLTLVGITGTNGKTTVAYLSRAVLEAAGRGVGLIGTVAYFIGSERLTAPQTTPEAVPFQALLSRMVESGLDTVIMEVSSHALALDRTVGSEFDVAIYTNLTQDHLDFHTDLEDYLQAKLKLFAGLSPSGLKSGPKRAIVNLDDPMATRVMDVCRVPVWTYAIKNQADIRAEDVELSIEGNRFIAATPFGRFRVSSRLVGEHNVYNLLAAIAVGLHEGVTTEVISRGIEAASNVPGRFERVEAGQSFTIVVDYAHTEDALSRLLSAAETIRTGRIITVFGCGGDRDRGKRPKMGRVAALKSDVVFLTSDNPRTEDPLAIIRDVEEGVREVVDGGAAQHLRYEVIPDRRRAIEAAVREARQGDMVLIAGKGHEDYQIIGTQRHHFDDREAARAAVTMIQ